MAWYCVEHWSRELALDIAFLKQEVSHLIAMHPQVVDFLKALTALGMYPLALQKPLSRRERGFWRARGCWERMIIRMRIGASYD